LLFIQIIRCKSLDYLYPQAGKIAVSQVDFLIRILIRPGFTFLKSCLWRLFWHLGGWIELWVQDTGFPQTSINPVRMDGNRIGKYSLMRLTARFNSTGYAEDDSGFSFSEFNQSIYPFPPTVTALDVYQR